MNSKNLWIIDDSEVDQAIYARFLLQERRYRYTIRAIFSQEELDEILKIGETPDAILLDFVLPDATGLELLDEIMAAMPSHSQVPVIMLTAHGDEMVAVEAMKRGAQDYLVKGKLTVDRFCRSIASVIEKADLHQTLEYSRELQRLLGTTALRVRQSLALEDILETTVREVQQFFVADRVVVYQLATTDPDDNPTSTMQMVNNRTVNNTIAAEAVLPPWVAVKDLATHDQCINADSILARHQATGTVRWIDDLDTADIDECYRHMLQSFQVRALLVVPILIDSSITNAQRQVWGLLIVNQCASPRSWRKIEIDFLEQLSVQLAIGIQQSQLYGNLENTVAERTMSLRQALDERELLLKEIHHRVKNNLQVISSLLSLQSRQTDEALVRAMFTESQNRVSAIALIHEQLYQNDNLSEINLQEYIKNLAQSLFTSFGERSAKIRLQVDVVPLMVNIETAMPCGLIINELMSNALKHAFNHTDSGTISVTLTFDDNKLITLTVADDGIGMNNSLNLNQSESEKEDNQKLLSQVNPKLSQLYKSRRSLGFKLIDNLVRQLKAKLTCSMSGGTKFEFQFIELNYYTRI